MKLGSKNLITDVPTIETYEHIKKKNIRYQSFNKDTKMPLCQIMKY